MKKWIVYGLALFISIVLVACSSSDEQTVTLQTEQNGVTMELIFKAEGDKVIEQSANNILPYESLGVTTPEEAEEILASVIAGYSETEGVTHSIDYQDDKAIETLTINYDEADLDEVNQLAGASYEGDTSQDVSLSQSVEMLEEQGFEKVE